MIIAFILLSSIFIFLFYICNKKENISSKRKNEKKEVIESTLGPLKYLYKNYTTNSEEISKIIEDFSEVFVYDNFFPSSNVMCIFFDDLNEKSVRWTIGILLNQQEKEEFIIEYQQEYTGFSIVNLPKVLSLKSQIY